MFIQMFVRQRFLVRHNKMDLVVSCIVFLHCVIWWLFYFGKQEAESHFKMRTREKRHKNKCCLVSF